MIFLRPLCLCECVVICDSTPRCVLCGTFMSTELNKVIYSMVGVSKFYDKKPVLKDIYLSYFYGAKIGVTPDR